MAFPITKNENPDFFERWLKVFKDYGSYSDLLPQQTDKSVQLIEISEVIDEQDILDFFDTGNSGLLDWNDAFAQDEIAFREIATLALESTPQIVSTNFADTIDELDHGINTPFENIAEPWLNYEACQSMSSECVLDSSIPTVEEFRNKLNKIDLRKLDSYTELTACLAADSTTDDDVAKMQKFVSALYYESNLPAYRREEKNLLQPSARQNSTCQQVQVCDEFCAVFVAYAIKVVCSLLHCSSNELSSNAYRVLGGIFASLGEHDAAKSLYNDAAKKADTQSQQLFDRLMAYSQMSDGELADHETELNDLLYQRIPVFEDVVVDWQKRTESVDRVSKGLEALYARGVASDFGSGFNSALEEFIASHQSDLSMIQGQHSAASYCSPHTRRQSKSYAFANEARHLS